MVMSGLVHGGRTFRYDRNTDKFEQYYVDKPGVRQRERILILFVIMVIGLQWLFMKGN